MEKENEKIFQINLGNSYVGLSNKLMFEGKLAKLRENLLALDVKKITLNNVEVPSVEDTIRYLRTMTVQQVLSSKLVIELN